MTQDDKDLLFKELSARHPYGVKLQVRLDYGDNGHKEGTYDADIEAITSYNIEVTYYDTNMHGMAREWTFMYEEVKPYLRLMSSMTEEENEEYIKRNLYGSHWDFVDWCNSRHLDYHGLIRKGLALEAPPNMYFV